jgi:SpoVK/Ycf46/Vps4 family AAA+-type ATPase
MYTEKGGVSKMINTVFKVAKLKAPSVIYINGAEMFMAKKVPKEDTTDPKRIKKEIIKYVKALKPSDRVLVIGVSSKPWDAEAKQMNSFYEKVILIPKPDYGTRYSLYWSFIHNMGGVMSRKLNLSILSRMSDALSASGIKYVCERVLTTRRLRVCSQIVYILQRTN